MDSTRIYQVGTTLDTATSAEEQKNILALLDETPCVALDLSQCTYVSSAGLRVMLYTYKTAKTKGGRLDLIGVNDTIREVMTMTGFDKFFTFYRTADEYIHA